VVGIGLEGGVIVTIGRHKTEVPAPRPASVVPLAPDYEPQDLQALYDRYRALSSKLAPDLVETPEMAVARAALIRALLDDGWSAPDIVHERLRADEHLLRPRLVYAS
jgi:hypothetical protein